MAVKTASQKEWISTTEARRILGSINYDRMNNIIRSGALTMRRFPGTHPEILRSDVERLLQESVIPSRRSAN